MPKILIVDDEVNLRRSLKKTFELEGWEAFTALHGKAALEIMEQEPVDLVLADLQMPVMDGLSLLKAMQSLNRRPPVVVLTAHASIDKAVEAVQLGAADFLEKPPHSDRVLLSAKNALERSILSQENLRLKQALEGTPRMLGESAPMTALREMIKQIAPTQARVLIYGEHGTGKELVAAALHAQSPRAGKPFVKLNCAAVPKDLFESELFGHVKGAFTGAAEQRQGRFRRADGGTLFLDEIGELPLELQPKLLRVLESGVVEPVGGDEERKVDVRLIFATNRDLTEAVKVGTFRPDLYYRIETVRLEVPPLRDRLDDLPLLVEHFTQLAAMEHGLPEKIWPEETLHALSNYDFPGNVRELKNRVERWSILSPGREIDPKWVNRDLKATSPGMGSARDRQASSSGSLKDRVRQFETQCLEEALDNSDGNVAEAARKLGLERSHFYKKMRTLGVNRNDENSD